MSRYSRKPLFDEGQFQDMMNQLFRNLRISEGFVARQKAGCCGSCISYDIASKVKNHGKPTVFTTRQDDYSRGSVYLKFGFIHNSDSPDFEKDDAIAGRIIADVAKQVGLIVVWNGTGDQCIRVVATKELAIHEAKEDLKNAREYLKYHQSTPEGSDGREASIKYGIDKMATAEKFLQEIAVEEQAKEEEAQARSYAFID